MERTLPAATWRLGYRLPPPLFIDLAAVVYLVGWWTNWVLYHWAADWFAYYSAWQGGLYDQAWNSGPHAYVYSPAFAQAVWPLTLLPADAFLALWTAALIGALIYLVGLRWTALLLFASFVPGVYTVWFNVVSGNIAIFLAVAIVLGFRRPGAWALMLLTKVTPGVGLLWFAVRREWRSLAMAIGVTMGITAVSLVIAPQLWADWFGVLAAGAQSPTLHPEIPSLIVRGPLAAALVVVAARRDWRWLVPVACMFALPQLGVSSLVILLAIPRLLRSDDADEPRHARTRAAAADEHLAGARRD